MSQLSVNHVALAFGKHTVVHDLSFTLEQGRIGCLLGASGCGKTTVLRAIAGFERLTGGSICLDGHCVSDARRHLAPERRRVGMVFQDYALFPHLSVADNIGFGLERMAAPARQGRVAAMLALIGLAGQGHKYPHEMSGGQQQRVALARALAPKPALLLLDEPFSNLDVELRERLSLEVREIIKESGTTAMLVTHDQHEAFAVADDIGIMHEGRMQQWASAYDLYHRPANRFVGDFIGQGVFVEGRLMSDGSVETALGRLHGERTRSGPHGCESCDHGCLVDVLIRPDDVLHDDASPMKARVTKKAFRGASILYTLCLDDGTEVLAYASSHHDHAVGECIGIRLDIDHVVAFPHDTLHCDRDAQGRCAIPQPVFIT